MTIGILGDYMKYKKFEHEIVLVLVTGEDIHKSINEVCELENVKMGSITGFGGIQAIEVGIWNNEKADYDIKQDNQSHMELTNLTGNISMLNDKVHSHIHVTISDNHFNMFGGHLVSGTVQNLMELYIYPSKEAIHRRPHKSWYFMDLENEVADKDGAEKDD